MSAAVVNILENLALAGGLRGADVANIAAVSPATVSRWTSGKASPHPKTQLVISDLRYVIDRLADFYAPDETRLWLYAPPDAGRQAADRPDPGRTGGGRAGGDRQP